MQLAPSLIETKADIAPCLSVVMPVSSEAVNVANLVRRVLEKTPVPEVVLWDDASSDHAEEAGQAIHALADGMDLSREIMNTIAATSVVGMPTRRRWRETNA